MHRWLRQRARELAQKDRALSAALARVLQLEVVAEANAEEARQVRVEAVVVAQEVVQSRFEVERLRQEAQHLRDQERDRRLRATAVRCPAGGWEVYSHGGRRPEGLDALDWCRRVAELGAGELLVTSMDRDGTDEGYDTALVAAVAGAVSIPVIASGGVGELAHLAAGLAAGADAVLAASIFHFGRHTIGAAKAFMAARGLPVRPPG